MTPVEKPLRGTLIDATSDPNEHPRTRATRWGRSALAVWAICAFVITGSLASAHWYSLPYPPSTQPQLRRALAERVRPEERGHFTITHVLYAQCRCSERILDHLVRRGARADVSESSLLVGASPALGARLRAAGYRVDDVGARELRSRFAIESAPLLIVADAEQHIRYLGGYTLRKQASDIHDVEIVDRALLGQASAVLPLFGCAVSRQLQALIDPLGLTQLGTKGATDD